MSRKELLDIVELRDSFDNIIKQPGKLGFITHINPDGDGLAACLGIKRWLESKSIKSDIILPGLSLNKLEYLDVNKHTLKYSDELTYENIIVLDCHGKSRIGDCSELVERASNVLVIDHHIAEDILDNCEYYIDHEAVSVGAIVHRVLTERLFESDKATQKYYASAIYTTIINDTNNFLNSNVDIETFTISAKMLELGLDLVDISQRFLYNKTFQEIKLAGESLSTIKTYKDDRVLIFNTSREMLDSNGLDDSATSKMTQWVKGTKGIEISLYYWQEINGRYKFSIRSEIYNVQQIADYFNGGGHLKAAGFTVEGDIDSIIKDIVRQIDVMIYG